MTIIEQGYDDLNKVLQIDEDITGNKIQMQIYWEGNQEEGQDVTIDMKQAIDLWYWLAERIKI